MSKHRYIWLLIFAMLSSMALARVVSVSSAAGISASTWQPGDTLVMSGTQWNNQVITLHGNGTPSQPIVLMSALPGAVTLTGKSTLTLDGSYLVADGLLFTGAFTGTSAIITFAKQSHHCRLTRTEIRDYNLSDPTKDTKWVSLYGQDHRVDYCSFSGKSNSGTLLVVWLTSGRQARHRIDHCQFGYRNPNLDSNGSELNGQEIIRIGDSSTSMTDAQCVVDSNYFEHCNGEIEIISNKSCGNTYRANTFFECKGMLTLRHGNNCLVEHNFFIGNDTSKTGGVRIIGENHTVRYNTMYRLAGNNYRAALCIVRGKPASALNEYFPVINAQVHDNLFIDCKQAFCLNYNSSSDCNINATGSYITDNQIYLEPSRANFSLIYVAHDITGGITLAGNVANRLGTFKNISPSELQLRIDPQMPPPSVTPIATTDNTGTHAVQASLQGQPSNLQSSSIGLTRSCNKYLKNGNIIISIHYETQNSIDPFDATAEYGIDGRYLGVRTNH